jgi:hypothetical protein
MARGDLTRRLKRSTEGSAHADQKAIENVSYAGNAVLDVALDFERKVKALKSNKDIDQRAVSKLAQSAAKLSRLAGNVGHEAEQFFFQNMPY